MKNRHRVSQVVSKLICSTGGQRKLLKQGAADRREYRQAAGAVASCKENGASRLGRAAPATDIAPPCKRSMVQRSCPPRTSPTSGALWMRRGGSRPMWRSSSRICSGTNAALNLRGALLDIIYQAKAGRQFRAPQLVA